MRTSPRNRSQPISSSGHGLTLVGLISLDLPAIVSAIFVIGATVPAALVLTLGYLPFGFFNAAFGRGNMDRLVFEGAEVPLLMVGAGTVLLLAAPTFYWRIQHFRRILRSTTTVPGQIRSLNFTSLEFSVDYVYWFQQRAYAGRNAIRRNHRREKRESLRPGQDITTLVDGLQPESSIVLELYSRNESGMAQ
ncbi:MAG: hypothetical protein F4047_14125 [Caldilineaceae bacterium SB0670_bin_27]|uniref:DUF3592 domain-containing protein n=1 Tax=Caldilineaceae bacterium SB0664_bin_27 TaxID=2605260 RepID=A0A6B0YXL2_9CHLR|nr:hypothetical protein [Caldilineaceae bacterium SB0664_bin_27]MYJ79248.1 hypothetical protein [Caldilineaceae bacterium SB0670_bin_27]